MASKLRVDDPDGRRPHVQPDTRAYVASARAHLKGVDDIVAEIRKSLDAIDQEAPLTRKLENQLEPLIVNLVMTYSVEPQKRVYHKDDPTEGKPKLPTTLVQALKKATTAANIALKKPWTSGDQARLNQELVKLLLNQEMTLSGVDFLVRAHADARPEVMDPTVLEKLEVLAETQGIQLADHDDVDDDDDDQDES